jgi:serine/threonine-protein kinase
VVEPGTLLEGKYEILDKIREGGMGSIYRVRHRLLEEIRVVKVMKPSTVADADLRRRFVEEARTATRLKHPNICTIHDFAIDESGMAYLVMEYIEGSSVSELLKLQGRPALPLALEIAHQSLLALGFLHRKGIVHRDVAPDNIMLTRDEHGGPLVKLIDLGIAKVAEGPVDATATGVFLGKLKYASPEQYGSLPKGQRLDGRSDLYGLGIVLYELLTGVLPFEGDTVVELLRAHVFAPPRPFAQSDPEGRIPAELRDAVLKSLQKRREDRHPSAEDFDREILAIQSRHVRPEDLEETRAVVAKLRPSREIRVSPATPSAQDHLDLQFGQAATPRPTRSTENDLTAAAPAAASWTGRDADVPTVPVDAAPVRRRPSRLVAAVAVIAAAIAAVLVMTRSKHPESPVVPSAALATPAAMPVAAERPTPEPTAPPTPEPTTVPPTPPPTAAPATLPPIRSRAVVAHPTAFPARPLAVPPSPAIPAPAPAAPAPAVEAVRLPSPVPAVPTEPARAAVAAPSPSARPVPTESDRLRELVRLYETAQNTLDPDLYVRIFPGVDRSRVQEAFGSFRSQAVEFEVRRIEIDPRGGSADVYGFESRLAVPKVGNEQRVNSDRVLHFEKRGDAWVITAIR